MEKRKKLALASDFDGTIYFMREDPPYKEGDREKIRQFQAAGNLFGTCSGRSLDGIRLVVGTGNFDFDFYILVTGALIIDRNFNIIHKRCIDYDLMAEIYHEYEDRVMIVIQANETVYSLQMESPIQIRLNSLEEIKDADIYGLSFGTGSPEVAREITGAINRKYGDRITAFTNVCNVDIVPKGCSKGEGIRIVKEHYGIDYIAGIGDSYNDVPMLESVDHPFTFHRSPEEVRIKARDLVDTAGEAVDILMGLI